MIYRNYLCVLLAIMCAPFFAHCQKTSFGAKAGINLSNIYSKDEIESGLKSGIHLGGYVNYLVKGRLYYAPEILYSQQGYKATYRESDMSSPVIGETNVNLHYINFLPLTAKYYLSQDKVMNIVLGPQIAWLATAKDKGEVNGETVNRDLKNAFKDFDFSMVVGLGADFNSGLNVGGRMNLGLTDILEWREDLRTVGKVKNIVYQVYLGYTF